MVYFLCAKITSETHVTGFNLSHGFTEIKKIKEENDMKEKLKNSRGITLVALVITIVIIIILSTIAFNFTFGENGLITRAQQAAEMTQIAQIQEQLEMAKGSAAIDGAGDIDLDNYFDIIEDEGIIDDKDTDVEDNGDGSYDVTTDGDYVFEVTPKPDGDLEIEYVGKNDEPRISSINVTDKTENSVTVEVVTKNVDGGEYTYSYKKTEEGEEAWQEAGSGSDSTFTISDLENNTSYDIKVTVTTGDTTIERTITVQIGTGVVEVPDNTITFGQVAWQGDGTASMPIFTTEPSFTLQYQVNGTDGEWITITSGQSITGLEPGDTVYTKLTDGVNDSEIQQTTIEDTIPPAVSVSSNGNTSSSISVNVQVADNQSGMADTVTYTYYIKQSSQGDESYQAPSGASNISESTYTFTNLTPDVSYDVKVEVQSDRAGNTGTGTLLNQTTGSIPGGDSALEDGTITVSEPEWEDGKATITVDTNTDFDIEYQVGDDGEWQPVGEDGKIPDLNPGDKVNIHLTDGTNDGENITITIEDTIPPTVNVTSEGNTSNSVSVSVEASDNESGMADSLTYTYYIKQSSQGDESYVAETTDIAQSTYTFTGLTQGISYDVKVEVKSDNAGNMGTGYLTGQTTTNIPGGEGIIGNQITVGETVWADGKARITASTDTSYSIEYQINGTSDGSWTNIGNSGTVPNLNYGDTVNIRLTDGTNHGDYAETTIRDEVNPVVDVKPDGLTTSNSIKVSVQASDNESGMTASPTYTYYIKQSSEQDTAYKTQAGSTNLTSNTYTFTGLTQGTSYDIKVEVTGDKANNTGTGYLAGQTTQNIPDASGPEVQEGAITFGNTSWSNNKASITISTNTSYQIEYQVGAITEGKWTGVASGGTISNLDYGDMVYARLTDGVNHGEYASASIDEKIAPEASIEATEVTSDSITVKVTASDAESGLATSGTYKYYLDNEGSPRETSESDTYTYSELNGDTEYTLKVVVTDVAGNEKEASTTATTEVALPKGWDGEKVTAAPSTDGKTVPVPIGYTASSATGETSVNDGFVIYEGTGAVNDGNVSTAKTSRNQFVWIPVNNISQIANQTSGTDANGRQNYQGKLYDFSTAGATEKSNYGQSTTSYREPDVVTENRWGGADHDANSDYLSILGLSSSSEFQTQLQEEFNEMIESVDTYGGFYIGRYETGNLVVSVNSKPVVVKGNNSISSVNWYYQYQNSRLIGANSNVVSTMIWGSMWDRTLIWLTETGDKTYSDLEDSRSWGNYSNSFGAAATNSGSKQPTGTNDAWQANNIYDLAGNVWEWTIEAVDTIYRVHRGGNYVDIAFYSNGSGGPASSRAYYQDYPPQNIGNGGSRSALFVALDDD